ncbi:hypothetical protein R1sor_010471 [Riccia sorocarpa]|uniref:Uncharacterized protein n=1 Tax=Riccia sorocarpa TaxID=122646 RepID=A0ABD3I216_9MARC
MNVPLASEPNLPQYKPNIDEAIYRATWRLQALLDEHNCSIELQDAVLKTLFTRNSEQDREEDGEVNYLQASLGQLLQQAGKDWRGGPLGLTSLCSLDAIVKCYTVAGMPDVQRWRLCAGSGDHRHIPMPYGPNKQDNYLSSGAKCVCSTKPTSGLQRLCERCTDRCEIESCSLPRKSMIPFDHLSLGSMLRLICKSRTFCHEMLTMWRARQKWLPRVTDTCSSEPSPTFPIKEWWDGSRIKEISWFWNPTVEFELPVICYECYHVYQVFPEKCEVLQLSENINSETGDYEFICMNCGYRVKQHPKYAKGDPRNIAVMAHWDGFQSASSVIRSTWAVELKVLNTGSATTIPVMPTLFIPDAKSEGSPKAVALNACLQPFVKEMIDLFVSGTEVEYSYPCELIEETSNLSSKFNLRAMLVLFTGDHPAQSMFGGFANSGMSGCRRCKVKTRWHVTPGRGVGGMTVLADNRLQFCYRPPRKTAKELQSAVARLAQSQTATQKRSISKETGVTSDSVAWQFHKMYGFDPSRDLTYDAMHVLALSMFKKYTEILKRDVENNPVQRAQFMEALTELTKKRPKVLKGRWPSDPFTRLGYFKAEEYSKFVLYCIPHILHVCNYSIDSVIAQLGRLVFEVGRLFYISSRSEQGWTIQALERCRLLMASWRIRGEEVLGATSSILDHVVGMLSCQNLLFVS